ncbi:MAG TPA: YggS family pyridoxal phosphate-dependent enzyme [Planctomycetes bacterium]|nr:YggS family pyridoxal phosphate-dependent enzyme [Planctomycetota bacterium]
MRDFERQLALIRQRITRAADASNRDPNDITILAVTKTASPNDLRLAWDCGQREFAHNRIEGLERGREILPDAEWHMIGRLQGKKVKKAWGCMDGLHSYDRSSLGERLNRAGEEFGGPPLKIWVQVALQADEERSGCPLDKADILIREMTAHSHLAVQGLMAMGPNPASDKKPENVFRAVSKASARLSEKGLLPCRYSTSMGMSNDLETAIAEGATLLRIGRALFPPK